MQKFIANIFPSSPESGANFETIAKPRPRLSNDSRSIVLLGTGGSGKTAIFKQMYLEKDDLEKRRHVLYETILEYFDMMTISNNTIVITGPCTRMGEFFEEYSRLGPKILSANKFWNQDVADKLFKLFYDTGFQDLIHRNRSKLYLHDNIAYFMRKKNFERIKHLSKLTIEDLMRVMIKTSGYSSFSPIKGISLCDTGGQRTERRKWNKIISDQGRNTIECLVVSLAEFDEVCYEDDITNRYEESLACFKEEFKNRKDLVILFSKYEVLNRKVCEGVIFSDYVSEFSGDNSNAEQVKDFIVGKYLEFDTEKKIRNVVVVNSAFDYLELQQVFNTITETNLFDSYFDEYLKKVDCKAIIRR